ncbi:MAG: N-formylglutamate amidohydrolase, partial [Acetobacter sp.]|nr:N-formylglutamate amidohydrolase [Acetobacter sp.]
MCQQIKYEENIQSFRLYGEDTGGPFLFVSDHAGQKIPSFLAGLGISEAARSSHIGVDIGIDGVGKFLAKKLSSLLIEQIYSRLVIDCNRAPGH